ncbi:MAG TPA: hypothetical protein VFV95_21160 [Vicinamibacterales bacterium]|nr:hypothetical protein [Vicinamibacterales bacterium]
MANVYWLLLFETVALTDLLLMRVRRDKLTAMVVADSRGISAGRIFRAAILAIALVGGLVITLAPEELVFPWLLPVLMMVPGVPLALFFSWQRRAVASLDAERTPRNAVLDLAGEPRPYAMWLAALPPLVTAGLVYFLATEWNSLVLRDPPPVPAPTPWQDPGFRGLVSLLLLGVVWNVYFGILSLTMWYGVSRQYAFRKSQVHVAVAFSWSETLLMPAVFLPLWLRVPPAGLLLCAASLAVSTWLLVEFGRRAHRDWQTADMPPSSYRFYFDRNDPSAFSNRGTNLGSPWNWALFTAPALFLVLPLLSFW